MVDEKTNEGITRLPCWSGKIEVAVLAGGITNRNYRVTTHDDQHFVVRIGRDIPEHGVMRFNELAAARAAFAAGVSPEVVHAEEGYLVSRFINGHTLTPETVRTAENLQRIVALLQRCHHDIQSHFQGPALIFWVFQVIRNYLRLLGAKQYSGYEITLDELADRAERLERLLGPVTIVFGHNDLLAANLIDDGRRLWLIDWDYAGFNSPLFDLANLASNNELSPELANLLLELYFGKHLSQETRRGFAAMQCASLLRESLWGAVSSFTSKIDFDYGRYACDHLLRFDRLWDQLEAGNG